MQVIIGSHTFRSKKLALSYYKNILNSYKFNEFLNESDSQDLVSLVKYNESCNQNDDVQEKNDFSIIGVRIAKVQFSTKCFELLYSNSSSQIISYRMMINQSTYSDNDLFRIACRNAICEDIRRVKQQYFDEYSIKGFAPCQESNEMAKWADLVVDHRLPNTFSIIIDRFKEVSKIKISEIEYDIDEDNKIKFSDQNISTSFIDYHKNKSNLRIVKKEYNSKRSSLSVLKRNSKDRYIQ